MPGLSCPCYLDGLNQREMQGFVPEGHWSRERVSRCESRTFDKL